MSVGDTAMDKEKTLIPEELKDETLDDVSGGSSKSRRDRHHPGPWFTPEQMWASGYVVIGDPNRPIREYNNHSVYGGSNPTRCPFCGDSKYWYDEGKDRYYCSWCQKQFYYYYE